MYFFSAGAGWRNAQARAIQRHVRRAFLHDDARSQQTFAQGVRGTDRIGGGQVPFCEADRVPTRSAVSGNAAGWPRQRLHTGATAHRRSRHRTAHAPVAADAAE